MAITDLIHFLTILGHNVTIKVSPNKSIKAQAHMSVALQKIKKVVPAKKRVTTVAKVQARKRK